jgi:hypothetical protein
MGTAHEWNRESSLCPFAEQRCECSRLQKGLEICMYKSRQYCPDLIKVEISSFLSDNLLCKASLISE